MLDLITPTLTRLAPANQPWRGVDDLLDLSELDDINKNNLPRLYVIEMAERTTPDVRGTGTPLQTVQLEIGVVIVQAKRNGKVSGIKDIREAVRQQLFGWQPHSEAEAFVLSGGSLLKINSGHVAWVDRFITEYTEDAAGV